MKISGCILGFVAFFIFCILLLLVLIRMKILNITSYYDGSYYKKKCDKATYFSLPEFPVVSNAGSYNKDLAKYLMQISYNVEASNCLNLGAVPVPQGFVLQKQLIGTSYDNIERPFGYIFDSPTEKLIVFTGTVFIDEWLEDFNVKQVFPKDFGNVEEGILCHKGFYDIYTSLREQITRDLTKKTYITGHSLGGALSTLCAFDLAGLKPTVYTFGSPRVFNTTGAQIYDYLIPDTQRVFNTEDIFTTVPLPVAFGENYEHVGSKGGISFTLNLGSLPLNHTDAYLKFLNIS